MPVARKLWLPSLVAMPADHCIGVRLRQHRASELAGATAYRAEQRPFGIAAQASVVEIGCEVFLEVMVARHRVALAALLAQPHPETAVAGRLRGGVQAPNRSPGKRRP